MSSSLTGQVPGYLWGPVPHRLPGRINVTGFGIAYFHALRRKLGGAVEHVMPNSLRHDHVTIFYSPALSRFCALKIKVHRETPLKYLYKLHDTSRRLQSRISSLGVSESF